MDAKIKDYQTSPLYAGLIGKTMAGRTRRQALPLRRRYLEVLAEVPDG